MFLGRIISNSKTIEAPPFIEVTPNYVDDGIPTIVVGKKRAIELFGVENIHVLDREIQKNLWWTYAKNERRADFEEDIAKFKKKIRNRIAFSVKYYFVNLLTEKLSFIKKLIVWFGSKSKKIVYITERHIYAYGGKDVIGISFNDLEYIGVNPDKVVKKISSNQSNTVVSHTEIAEKFREIDDIAIPFILYQE